MKDLLSGAAICALGLGASLAGAAGAVITVSHDYDGPRPGSVVLVPWDKIAAVAPDLRMYHVVVRDPKGRSLPLQIPNYEHDHRGAKYDELLFWYDFAAGQKTVDFTLEPVEKATPPDAPCVYARFVPERYDDMAWENDRIAHRMYGPALDTEAAGGERLRGSGIDIWAKRVTYPIVDRWYQKGHDQFHKDGEGEGLDLYSIGGSRGAGGTGVWDGTKLWTSDNFLKADVAVNGPRVALFSLAYAPWDAGSAGKVSEKKYFQVDCGRNLNLIQSVFEFEGKPLTVGIGITEHAQAQGFPPAVLTKDPDGRWMSFWEENKDGGLGIAVVLGRREKALGFAHEDPAKKPGNGNNLLLVEAQSGVSIKYFTGAGWTGSGQFKDRAAWEKFVRDTAARVQKPLTIDVKARP